MKIIVNDQEIDYEKITAAWITDRAGDRADSVYIETDADAQTSIKVLSGHASIEADGFKISNLSITDASVANKALMMRATSLPPEAKEEGWNCFENVTLQEIMDIGAKAMSMKAKLYGVNGNIKIRRIIRRGQTWPEFLKTLMRNEGAAIKFDSGAVLAIGYDWAFSQKAQIVMEGEPNPDLDLSKKAHFFTVTTGFASATAVDRSVPGGACKRLFGTEQVYDNEQAMRAAKGHLTACNLLAETYTRGIELNTSIAAMTRIDVEGTGPEAGRWIVWEVTHDLKKKTTMLKMHRCMNSIA